MSDKVFDVIQVGYGPVSETMALMLGRQGRSVAVCERWATRYPLPRAVSLDHEIYRVLSALGMAEVLPEVTHAGLKYEWFNADWKELISFDWAKPSISGGSEVVFVHQPTLESALDAAVQENEGVELFLGWEVEDIEQDADLAYVHLRHLQTGEEKRLAARYVIGCDGANSIVRNTIGGEREDRGFEADWLVIDVLLKDGVTIETLGLPPAGQWCNPARPTTIVPGGVRGDQLFRRWEFMLLPGERVEDLEREEVVWELLRPWAGPDQVELIRHKVYNFRSLVASRWRDRRLLLAGDAAHVMPPFMGQGMCSGMRDAWNLAWKLNLILDHKAEDNLLDTYQVERLPHVSQIIDMAIYLGKVICIPDAVAAAERDAAFLSGSAPPPPSFPQLTDGLLHRSPANELQPGAGYLSPHVRIEKDGKLVRLDEFGGNGGFLVISRHFDAEAVLRSDLRVTLNTVGVRFVVLVENGAAMDGLGRAVEDADGRIDAMLDKFGWSAMIVRPDYYIYGGASSAGAFLKLAASLTEDLMRAGVRIPAVHVNELA